MRVDRAPEYALARRLPNRFLNLDHSPELRPSPAHPGQGGPGSPFVVPGTAAAWESPRSRRSHAIGGRLRQVEDPMIELTDRLGYPRAPSTVPRTTSVTATTVCHAGLTPSRASRC